jgi:hypothetical protein
MGAARSRSRRRRGFGFWALEESATGSYVGSAEGPQHQALGLQRRRLHGF